MRVNVYKYTNQGNHDCVGAQRVKTIDVEVFPSNQTEFAETHGGDFIEIEDSDANLHWAGALQEDRERHLRELLEEGIERPQDVG